jgi:hypothetical protein
MSGTDAWMPAVIAHGFYRPPRHDLSAIRTTETEQEIEAELNQGPIVPILFWRRFFLVRSTSRVPTRSHRPGQAIRAPRSVGKNADDRSMRQPASAVAPTLALV